MQIACKMNNYEIFGIIGQSKYCVIFKARNSETGEIVAIKKVKLDEENKMIKRQVKILKLLNHENIIGLKDNFKIQDSFHSHLVFEYIDKNLYEVILNSPNGLNPLTIRKIIQQIIKAIEQCHQHEIVHRNIKPENILIKSNGQLKVCGFGNARTIQTIENEPLTDYVSTRWYRAPEQILSDQAYGKEIDIWAIGCLLCELADGNPLLPGENEVDQLFLIQKRVGSLTQEQIEQFSNNPNFQGLTFPQIENPETIETRFKEKLSKNAISLVKGLLRIDPKLRMTASEALIQPYFQEQ